MLVVIEDALVELANRTGFRLLAASTIGRQTRALTLLTCRSMLSQGRNFCTNMVLQVFELPDRLDYRHLMAGGAGKLCIPWRDNDPGFTGPELRWVRFSKMAWYTIVLRHYLSQPFHQHLPSSPTSEDRGNSLGDSCCRIHMHSSSTDIPGSPRLSKRCVCIF